MVDEKKEHLSYVLPNPVPESNSGPKSGPRKDILF